ncbi:hypothetical protein D3C80_2072980 [compost metagenome]
MGRLATHLFKGVEDAEAFQQVQRGPRHALQVWLASRQQLLEQLLLVHEAQRLIDAAIADQREA